MINSVAGNNPQPDRRAVWNADATSLYTRSGARKYLNHAERQRALTAMAALPADQALFALTLAWTGARISEVLALTPSSFQVEAGLVAIRTLKRRMHHMREVPLPPELIAALDRHFGCSARRRDPQRADRRLWRWSRTTAWRLIKGIMTECNIAGRQACSRGLRHAFGISALRARVPLNLLQRWLGHACISTTAIYADASGPEEMFFAERFWVGSKAHLAKRMASRKVSKPRPHFTRERKATSKPRHFALGHSPGSTAFAKSAAR